MKWKVDDKRIIIGNLVLMCAKINSIGIGNINVQLMSLWLNIGNE